jgi:hypothetical protein
MAIHDAALLDSLPQDSIVYVGVRLTPTKDPSAESTVFHLWASDCGAMGGDGSPRSLTIGEARAVGRGVGSQGAWRAERREAMRW